MEKMNALDKAVSAKIEGVLTAQQRSEESKVVRNAQSLRSAGIPLDLYGKLKLTSEQESRIVAIGEKMDNQMKEATDGDIDPESMRTERDQTRHAVRAVLTADQRKMIDEFMRSRIGFGPIPVYGGPPPRPGGPPPGGSFGSGGGR